MILFSLPGRASVFTIVAAALSLWLTPLAGPNSLAAQAQTTMRSPVVTPSLPARPLPPPSRTRTDASGRTTYVTQKPPLKGVNLKTVKNLAQQADANCEVIDAANQPKESIIRDGKTLSGQIHEVACHNTRGYLLLAKGSKLSEAIPCHISWELRAQSPTSYACRILANRYSPDWISDRANAKLPDCGPTDALWIHGYGKDTSIIEVHCANGLGGVLSFPSRRDTSDGEVTLISCLKLLESETKCLNTNAPQAAKTFGALFADKLPACTINNGRFIGANATAEFYEIGCEDVQPFILATTASGQFVTVLDCEKAANVGGCQFSPAAKSPETNTSPPA